MSVIISKDLKSEFQGLIEDEFPSDKRTNEYLAKLLAYPPIDLGGIRFNWVGIIYTEVPEDGNERERNRNQGKKLKGNG